MRRRSAARGRGQPHLVTRPVAATEFVHLKEIHGRPAAFGSSPPWSIPIRMATPVRRGSLLKQPQPPMLKTFTTSGREYILITAIVLATVAAMFIPFAWDTAATVKNLESRGLPS